MSEWKDKRKNIYTITVVTIHGRVAIIETHSNKKQADTRLERLTELYVTQKSGRDDAGHYRVAMHTTKLQRKPRY